MFSQDEEKSESAYQQRAVQRGLENRQGGGSRGPGLGSSGVDEGPSSHSIVIFGKPQGSEYFYTLSIHSSGNILRLTVTLIAHPESFKACFSLLCL